MPNTKLDEAEQAMMAQIFQTRKEVGQDVDKALERLRPQNKLDYLVTQKVLAGYTAYPDKDGNDTLCLQFLNGDSVVIQATPIQNGYSAGLLVDGEEVVP